LENLPHNPAPFCTTLLILLLAMQWMVTLMAISREAEFVLVMVTGVIAVPTVALT
jgi:hypothetical protein